jgi:hypothetical protein
MQLVSARNRDDQRLRAVPDILSRLFDDPRRERGHRTFRLGDEQPSFSLQPDRQWHWLDLNPSILPLNIERSLRSNICLPPNFLGDYEPSGRIYGSFHGMNYTIW